MCFQNCQFLFGKRLENKSVEGLHLKKSRKNHVGAPGTTRNSSTGRILVVRFLAQPIAVFLVGKMDI